MGGSFSFNEQVVLKGKTKRKTHHFGETLKKGTTPKWVELNPVLGPTRIAQHSSGTGAARVGWEGVSFAGKGNPFCRQAWGGPGRRTCFSRLHPKNTPPALRTPPPAKP